MQDVLNTTNIKGKWMFIINLLDFGPYLHQYQQRI